MDTDALLSLGKLFLSQPNLLKSLTSDASHEHDSSFLEEFLRADDDEEGHASLAEDHPDHRALLLALKPYLGKERRAGIELLLKISPILELLSK